MAAARRRGHDGHEAGTGRVRRGHAQNFRAHGVDTPYVGTTDQALRCGADPRRPGRRQRHRDRHRRQRPDHRGRVEQARTAMAQAGVVVCQLEIPVATTLAALRAARQAGARTVLNPAPAREDLPEELSGLRRRALPDQTEAALLTGRPAGDSRPPRPRSRCGSEVPARWWSPWARRAAWWPTRTGSRTSRACPWTPWTAPAPATPTSARWPAAWPDEPGSATRPGSRTRWRRCRCAADGTPTSYPARDDLPPALATELSGLLDG